jgi:small GTP-binding protein
VKSSQRICSYTIVVLGDHLVAKSGLIRRIITGKWTPITMATISMAVASHPVTVRGEEVQLRIFDTPVLEEYASQCPLLVRDARAAIIVYEANRPQSYESVARHISRYTEHCIDSTAFVVVAASKSDLIEFEQAQQEADKLARARTGPWVESFVVSSLTGQQVEDLVQFVAGELLGRVGNAADTKQEIEPARKKSLCC